MTATVRTPGPVPDWAHEGSIPARLAEVVRAQPGRIALQDGARSLSYAELGAWTARLAGALREGPADGPVAILLPHGALAPASLLGVIGSGRVCVALDPDFPSARVSALLVDSQAETILTDAAHISQARSLAGPGCSVLDVGALGQATGSPPDPRTIAPEAPAVIVYSSGSTGEPKGIVWPHRMQLHNAGAYARAFGLTPADRLTMLHSLAFSSGQVDTYAALLNGATLCVFDVRREGPARLAAWLDAQGITVYNHIPSAFRQLAAAIPEGRPPRTVRIVALGSEPTRASDVALFQRAFAPPCRLITRFGATEAANVGLYVADHESAAVEDPLPAGWPVADREVLLLDESGAPVGPEEVGEIAIRSRYIALGYWRRPDLTAAAFSDDPAGDGVRVFRMGDVGRRRADGCLIHLGRKDDLVKVRGHRVELGEVERVLLATPGIADGAVVAQPDRHGGTRLVGYVVASEAAVISTGALSATLRATLPGFMVPSAFVCLDDLPRTPTGKVDRRALSAPDPVRPALATPFVAPSSPIERKVAAIWAEALTIEPVGLDDNFLELGGDSLTAARVATRAGEALGVTLGPQDLLVSGTVRAMAAVLLERCMETLGPGELEALLGDVEHGPG